MTFRSLLIALPLLLAAPTLAAAQMLPFGFALEARAGLATPTGEFSESDESFTAESGVSYALGARFNPVPMVGFFAAFQRTDFDCEQCALVGLDESVRLEGLEAGVDLGLPIGELPISPWFRAGIAYQQFVFAGFDAESASDAALGFTGGVGLSIPVLGFVEILPGLRYFSVPVEYTFDSELRGGSFDASAFTADLGVAIAF